MRWALTPENGEGQLPAQGCQGHRNQHGHSGLQQGSGQGWAVDLEEKGLTSVKPVFSGTPTIIWRAEVCLWEIQGAKAQAQGITKLHDCYL